MLNVLKKSASIAVRRVIQLMIVPSQSNVGTVRKKATRLLNAQSPKFVVGVERKAT